MTLVNQTTSSKSLLWLFWCVMAYGVMNGAQLWETFIFVPAWTAAPPASLHFFHGPYGVDLKVFWIVMHSIHDLLFIIAVVTNWSDPGKRNPLLFLFVLHMAVRAWTFIYFAPAIMWFQAVAPSQAIDPSLVAKAALWQNLNYLRVALFCLINLSMIFLLIKPTHAKQ